MNKRKNISYKMQTPVESNQLSHYLYSIVLLFQKFGWKNNLTEEQKFKFAKNSKQKNIFFSFI